ncbi:hypothetical protein BH24ACT15_BH24ACT15_01490 [soil metagenome]
MTVDPTAPDAVAPTDDIPVDADDFHPDPMDQTVRRFVVPWEWFDAVAVYGVWVVLLGAATFAIQQAATQRDAAVVLAAQILISLALLIGITAAWVSLRATTAGVDKGLRRALGIKRPQWRDVWRGVAYGIAAFVAVQIGLGAALSTVITWLGGEVPEIQQEVQDAVLGSGSAPLLVVFGVAVLAPLGEELLFRGLLYQGLAKRLPGWPAVGLSGLAFGLTHLEPFVIVLTFPLGMALAWMFRRHGTLVVPAVAHAMFNLIGVIAIRTTV